MGEFKKLEGYPPELTARFNSFITTQFDDSLSVEMQIRSLIKWINSSRGLINDMVDYLNLFIERFDKRLQTEIVNRLNEWLADGTLAQIINDDVFDMKADTVFVEQEINRIETTVQQALDDFSNTLNAELDVMNDKYQTLSEEVTLNTEKWDEFYAVNIRHFGAVGDGVTDDTQAIQNAINSMQDDTYFKTLLFPQGVYLVDSLTIPNKLSTTLYQGMGQVTINFTGSIGFRIQSEGIKFRGIRFDYVGEESRGDILFLDDRQYRRLDFDIEVKDNDIRNWRVVIDTWGRGATVSGNLFTDIVDYLVKLTIKPKSEIDESSATHQKYHSGYRGYFINNNRFHFCNNLWIMVTPDPADNVLNGVEIKDNVIEGTIRYFKGYVRDFVCTNNNHYLHHTPRTALFHFHGGENILVDVKVGGKQVRTHGESGRLQELVVTDAYVSNLKITGAVNGVEGDVVMLHAGGEAIEIDLLVNDLSPTARSVVQLTNGNFDGLLVRGVVRSVNEQLIGVRDINTIRVNNFNFDHLMLIGSFDQKTNIS